MRFDVSLWIVHVKFNIKKMNDHAFELAALSSFVLILTYIHYTHRAADQQH